MQASANAAVPDRSPEVSGDVHQEGQRAPAPETPRTPLCRAVGPPQATPGLALTTVRVRAVLQQPATPPQFSVLSGSQCPGAVGTVTCLKQGILSWLGRGPRVSPARNSVGQMASSPLFYKRERGLEWSKAAELGPRWGAQVPGVWRAPTQAPTLSRHNPRRTLSEDPRPAPGSHSPPRTVCAPVAAVTHQQSWLKPRVYYS